MNISISLRLIYKPCVTASLKIMGAFANCLGELRGGGRSLKVDSATGPRGVPQAEAAESPRTQTPRVGVVDSATRPCGVPQAKVAESR